MPECTDQPNTVVKSAAVIIIDGVDSVAIANVLGPKQYDDVYLQPLHKCYRSVLVSADILKQVSEDPVKCIPTFTNITHKYVLNESCFVWWGGDELVIVFCCDDVGKDILAALWLGTETLMRWYQREPNLARLREGSEPYHLSCGVHYGPVSFSHRRSVDNNLHRQPEGIAFAYAKRAQAEARSGTYTRMFITEEVELNRKAVEEELRDEGVFAEWKTEDKGMRCLKGLGRKHIYEVKWFVPPRFLTMPRAYDAIYNFLMESPVQPGLAFCVYNHLKQNDEESKASKLRGRFAEIGHEFPT